MELTYHRLRDAVAEDAAIRYQARLQPIGGPGDKIFPPTYEGSKYAEEERIIDGQRVPCVLLDSVQSQANRLELALLEAWRDGRIELPILEVDFSGVVPELGVITSLEVPHRIADAILRDSQLDVDGKLHKFRDTIYGKALEGAALHDVTGLFRYCPTALIFGVWDSTGAASAEQGAKFPRALVSEIVAINAVVGVVPSSRIDPLGIGGLEKAKIEIYEAADGSWTLEASEAALDDKQKPKKIKASNINHGNVTPSISQTTGGITCAYAEQRAALSLPALRRYRFPLDEGDHDPDRDLAAQTVLAALALVALAGLQKTGLFLRSRCHLIPDSTVSDNPTYQIVTQDGVEIPFQLDLPGAETLLREALDQARAKGLSWETEPIRLYPQPKLIKLIQKMRATSGES